MPAQR